MYVYVGVALSRSSTVSLFKSITAAFKTLPREKSTPSFLDNGDVILLF